VDTEAIRSAIAEAARREAQSHSLRNNFASRLDELQQKLLLPDNGPLDALVEFARLYIAYVPDFLEQIAAQESGPSAQGYLNMAEDFFLAPPEIIAEEQGLEALLDEAFLAQRLLEELNEEQLRLQAEPLLKLDMTRANIIVHHLLGEPLASRLEALVSQCLAWLTDRSQSFSWSASERLCARGIWQEAPCMSRAASIDLRLTDQLSSPPSEAAEG
jgi:hypothetical protein